jgi:hypothetical protein
MEFISETMIFGDDVETSELEVVPHNMPWT